MDFSFLGMKFRFDVVKNNEEVGLKDVFEVNDQVRRYINSLSHEELKSRISKVSFSSFSDMESIRATIEESGIVLIEDFFPDSAMKDLKPFVDKIRSRLKLFIDSQELVSEDSNVLLQKGTAKLSGYHDMASYSKAVVQVRKGQDDGMVDIFNVDKWFQDIGFILRPFFESAEIAKFIRSGSEFVEAKNLNFYFNSGIKKTRGFHVDSYGRQLKAFVYLTDVSSLEDGPYTYVKGSHVDTGFRRINKKISSVLPNKTESPVVPLQDIIPVLAPKGALVISDQGGVHRGFPQAEGHERAIAVMNYR